MKVIPLIEGLFLGSALIVAIGAQNAFVLRQGLIREHVFIVCSVCFLGDVLLISLGVGGFGTFFSSNIVVLLIIGWLGVLFLTFFAIRSFISARNANSLSVNKEEAIGNLPKTIGSAMVLTFFNPHVYLDTIVVIGGMSAQFENMGKVFFALGAIIASLIWFFSLGYGASKMAPIISKPSVWRIIDLIVGLVMTVLALSLLRWIWEITF